MARRLMFSYSVAVYFLFHLTFLALIAFVGNWLPQLGIDSGAVEPWGGAAAINLGLIGLFGLQHTIMARAWFKERWKKIIPEPLERSTFILFTLAILGLMCWQWRPMPMVIWNAETPFVRLLLSGISLAGWLVVPAATFLLDHLEFTGLRQTWNHLHGKCSQEPRFRTPGFYQWVRHPMLLGVLVAIWATPTMTVGHLLFASGFSLYIAIGVCFEERDLLRLFGKSYENYRRQTPMLIPLARRIQRRAPRRQDLQEIW